MCVFGSMTIQVETGPLRQWVEPGNENELGRQSSPGFGPPAQSEPTPGHSGTQWCREREEVCFFKMYDGGKGRAGLHFVLSPKMETSWAGNDPPVLGHAHRASRHPGIPGFKGYRVCERMCVSFRQYDGCKDRYGMHLSGGRKMKANRV